MTVGGGSGPAKSSRPNFSAALFDLDDTLYRQHKIPAIVKERIQEYMATKLGIPREEVAARCLEYYLSHGTSLAGLVAHGYRIDYDDWHEFVHQGALDYDTLLQPDPSLRDILCSIDLPKYILTNANVVHMERCLQRLGIADCFQGFYHFENINELAASHGINPGTQVVCKPAPRTYTLVAEKLGISLSEVIFFDDSIRNVAAAHALGATTVLVGADVAPPGADLAVPSLHDLPAVMPELLDQPGLVHDSHGHSHVAVHASAAAPGSALPAALAAGATVRVEAS